MGSRKSRQRLYFRSHSTCKSSNIYKGYYRNETKSSRNDQLATGSSPAREPGSTYDRNISNMTCSLIFVKFFNMSLILVKPSI
jgi:hypothetical protein